MAAVSPLPTTKLLPPKVPAWAVARSRLDELLDHGTSSTLTLVSAPPGFGKTTLLADWAARRHCRARSAGWAGRARQLTGADLAGRRGRGCGARARARRSSRIVRSTSVRRCRERPDQPDRRARHSRRADPRRRARAGRALDPQRHRAPDQACAAAATPRSGDQIRSVDPARQVSALGAARRDQGGRARDDVGRDPRAARPRRGRLSQAEIETLCQRTDGWAAALRLAAISLESVENPHRFVAEFAADDRAISDYLLNEVLDQQPDELRTFLLQTSLPDRFTAELAADLTGRTDAGAGARRSRPAQSLPPPPRPGRTHLSLPLVLPHVPAGRADARAAGRDPRAASDRGVVVRRSRHGHRANRARDRRAGLAVDGLGGHRCLAAAHAARAARHDQQADAYRPARRAPETPDARVAGRDRPGSARRARRGPRSPGRGRARPVRPGGVAARARPGWRPRAPRATWRSSSSAPASSSSTAPPRRAPAGPPVARCGQPHSRSSVPLCSRGARSSSRSLSSRRRSSWRWPSLRTSPT